MREDAALQGARRRFRTQLHQVAASAFAATSVLAFLSLWAASRWAPDRYQWVAGAALLAVVDLPIVLTGVRLVAARVSEADEIADTHRGQLELERRQRDWESQLSDALEMADHETAALGVIRRGFAVVAPEARIELLLADNSHAQLSRMAVAGEHLPLTGCGVRSPQECPAARRGRTHRFDDSAMINACPHLADRSDSRCAAVCIPLSVMGRTVGVVHAVRDASSPVTSAEVAGLQTIADQSGIRLGVLRIMAQTQLQASTDPLTGLMNRRAFENAFVQLRHGAPNGSGVVAMGDLDNFKLLNDTHGHETGDRALRLFAVLLRQGLRSNDLLSRHGGEEFAVAFPECDLETARTALDRVRTQLAAALRESGLPAFTVSFGLTPAFYSEDLDLLLARADAALFAAKGSGRDQIVSFTASDLDDPAERAALTIAGNSPSGTD